MPSLNILGLEIKREHKLLLRIQNFHFPVQFYIYVRHILFKMVFGNAQMYF